jgi:hypothetical protein
MGQEWQVGYGFITNRLEKNFYHESCFNNLNENREVKNEIIKDTNIN